MTATPPPDVTAAEAPAGRSRTATAALYLAIGALVAAAALGAYFIIAGDQANVAGRAWLTLLLVALFAGAVVLDANVGTGPNRWYLGVSTIVNVIIVAVGLMKLWNGWLQPEDTAAASVWFVQMVRVLGVIVLLRLALLFMQLYGLRFVTRGRTRLGKIMAIVTIGLVWATAIVLAIPAVFPEHDWPDWWWRVAGATSLVAVVTAVIPLLLRAFEPKVPKPPQPVQQPGYVPAQQAPPYYAAPAQAPVQQQFPRQHPGQPVYPGVPVPQQPMQQPPAPQPGSQPPAPAQPPVPPGAPTPPQRPRRSAARQSA
ncbi:MAG: hypothetical protein EAS51_04725 [Microbacteriaceae bacterium]|nr:MAG: hypothetical protein EAS51_04725 [Microbacteriaceae bacterium]